MPTPSTALGTSAPTSSVRVNDPRHLRRAFAHYPSGIAALAASVGGTDLVLVASSFTVGVSFEPALVLFSVQTSSTTWPRLRQAARIGVSVLAGDQAVVCRGLASKTSENRWEGVDVERGAAGALYIGGASGSFECSIVDEHPAGDHRIVVMEVHALHTDPARDPLIFHGSRFRSLSA